MTMMRDIADRATQTREVRAHALADIEIREDAGTGGWSFDGVPSRVDTPYKVRDMFGEYEETIAKGAYNRTIKQKADVRLLVNHAGVPLARTKSGTLELSANPDLRSYAPQLDRSNPTVQEVRSAIDRGDIDQMSIGFRVKDQRWSDDYTEREIREVELFEVSIVTFPASPTTSATMRSLDEWLSSLENAELTEDEIRRGHEFFAGRLPVPAPDFAERDRDDLARLERKRLLRPEFVA